VDPALLAVIAAIAAVLSALAAAVSAGLAASSVYLQRQAMKPQVRVEINTKIPIGIPGMAEETFLAIDVQNRGAYPVVVDGVGYELRDRRTAPVTRPFDVTGAIALPKPLGPGEAVSIVTDIREIAHVHVTEGGIRCAYATTAAGGRYRSEEVRGGWLATYARRAPG
jgi:hypothetical protein